MDAIVGALAIAEEPRVGMGLSPEGDDTYAVERGYVHGGGIHGEHDVEIGHEGHLVGEGHDTNHDMASVAAIGKVRRTTFLLVASAEEEDADIGMLQ